MRKLIALFSALVLVCLSTGSLFAQVNASGTLVGTVTDKTGGVVPGADVKISNKEIGLNREIKTNGAGQYRFDLLPTGNYEVRVSMPGFASAVFQNVALAVSQTATIDASLAPSAQAETVTVESAGMVMVDTEKTDASLAITPKMVEDLPLNGRDFVNLASLAPGARPVNSYDPTKNRYGVFAVNGSGGRNVNVTVNGIDDKDNSVGGPVMQLPLEAILEMQVSTQRFSAANGRSEGAAITAVTKSGGNEIHGSLYFLDRNEALNTNDYFTEQQHQPKPPYSRQQFGGSIGGPVKKNQDFVFFAIEREREATNIITNPTLYKELVLAEPIGAQPAQLIPTPYFDWRYNGRFDHKINDKNNVFFSYTNQHNIGYNDQSGSGNDLTAGNFTTNSLILSSLNINSVLTPNIVNAMTFGYQYWNNVIDSTKKYPTVSFASGEYFGTNGNVPQQTFQKKWQFKDDISITHGKHNFKMGYDYVWEPALAGFFEFTPTPSVTFLDDPSTILSNTAKYPQGFQTPGAVIAIAETAGNPYYNFSDKMFGLYFQDDWKVSKRLTLNLGLRWDKDFNLVGGKYQPASRTYLELKAINSPYAGIPKDDNKDFSPRIGVAYDLTGHGKHILRGGFGIYYGQIFNNITLFMDQQANPTIFATVLSLSSIGPGDPQADPVPGTGKLLSQWRYGIDPIPAPPPPPTNLPPNSSGRVIAADYHNPYTEQFNGGYTWALNDANVIEVDYVHVLGLRESKTINLNPKDPNNGGARVLNAALVAAGQPPLAAISMYASLGRSRYDGMNVAYRRRLSKRVSLNASYVFSKAVAYNGASAGFGNGPSDANIWFAPHDFGPTPSDERHRGVISGVVNLPWKINFAPIMQIASARPYSAKEGIDYLGEGNSSTGEFAVLLANQPTNYKGTAGYTAAQVNSCLASGACVVSSYDALRGLPFFQFDARVSRAFRIHERMNLEFIFQAFDLTNRANFGGSYQGNIRSTAFETPTNYVSTSGVIIPHQFSGEAGFKLTF
jgi:hypothetical protein